MTEQPIPLDDDTVSAIQLAGELAPRRRVADLSVGMILHGEARNGAKGSPWIIDHAGLPGHTWERREWGSGVLAMCLWNRQRGQK